MYLFFDTETTGLPKDWKLPPDQFPRLVQIAWLLYDENEKLIDSQSHIIKPNGFEIPIEASKIHGITNEMALNKGIYLVQVLHDLLIHLVQVKYVIGHNLSYDRKIVRGELMRQGVEYDSSNTIKICTMHSSRNYCRIKGKRGYKIPTLQELHNKLFGCGFDGAHNAMNDVKATAKCFFELKRLGILNGKL